MRRYQVFMAAMFAITVAPLARAALFQLNVIPAQSTADVTVQLLTPLGNGSDSDSSPLSGFVLIETDSEMAPFGSAQILDLALNNTDAVSLSICVVDFFGCQAGVDVDAAANDIQVDLVAPGPSAVVTGGVFTQVNNAVEINGMLVVDATGLANGQVPEGDFVLNGMAIGNMTGTIGESAGVVDLSIQINAMISETDLMTGVTTETSIASTVVATGTQVQPGDMNCSGAVTLDDVPLFVQAMLNDPTFAGCAPGLADVNGDNSLNGNDIAALLAAL